jgi:hypothetical protein
MEKRIMRRTAADNTYRHPDFHGALSNGIEYLERTYGPEAVREYLWQFSNAFYAPLKQRIAERGLDALREYLEDLYGAEGGRIHVRAIDDGLHVEVESSPDVMHMRSAGYHVARLFREVTSTVNEAICAGTPFKAELLEYDEQTGRSVQRFTRRDA